MEAIAIRSVADPHAHRFFSHPLNVYFNFTVRKGMYYVWVVLFKVGNQLTKL